MKTLFPIIIIFLFNYSLQSKETRVKADPDFVSSGISWCGTGQVKLGDVLKIKGFRAGGMVVVRNEETFNQGWLPNHNWRGFLYMEYRFREGFLKKKGLSIGLGLEHESAHPTMGIREDLENQYQGIYDGSYRRCMLNSAVISASKNWDISSVSAEIMGEYQFYLYSKNTPELLNLTPGYSNGISLGAEVTKSFKKTRVYISVFDRYVFQGWEDESGEVHKSSDMGIVEDTISYPVINHVNTLTLKTGYEIHVADGARLIGIYASILYGNIFGFVDSRDSRCVFRIGVQISR